MDTRELLRRFPLAVRQRAARFTYDTLAGGAYQNEHGRCVMGELLHGACALSGGHKPALPTDFPGGYTVVATMADLGLAMKAEAFDNPVVMAAWNVIVLNDGGSLKTHEAVRGLLLDPAEVEADLTATDEMPPVERTMVAR